ncbi:MAG: DNA-binding protein [Rhodocyclaceae bacterium]|nr:DNA-binding protein [Rhodocyclaceae bacterium]
MATNLIVRNVDESVALALKQRAAAHGRSAEAEHREILRDALQGPQRLSLTEFLLTMPDVGRDEDFARQPVARQRGRAA